MLSWLGIIISVIFPLDSIVSPEMGHIESCLYNKGSIYWKFDLEQSEAFITKVQIQKKENNTLKPHINLIYKRNSHSEIIDSLLAQILLTLVSRFPKAYRI